MKRGVSKLLLFLVILHPVDLFTQELQTKYHTIKSTQTINIDLEFCKKLKKAKAELPAVEILPANTTKNYEPMYYSLLPYMTDENTKFCEKLEKANETPRIEIDYKVILSSAMEKTLKEHEPTFKIFSSKHFNPYIISSYKFGEPFYAHEYYRIFQSPSAVIGDFNGDNKLDVVLLGYKHKPQGVMEYQPSKKFLMLLVFIISKDAGYKVFTRNIRELPETFDPEKPSKDFYWLELVKKGEKITNCAGDFLELKADGIKQLDTEEGDGGQIFYYENGQINSFFLCYKDL